MIERPSPLRAAVLGDLVADVVLLPSRPLRSGTDVAGRVAIRQGGSAATTARVLAGSGVRTSLVTAIGADAAGPSLVAYLESCAVEVHAVRLAAPSGRLGVLVEASGERTFVADRGAILSLRPRHLRASWLRDVSILHLPGYSLVGEGLAAASERAAALARHGGAMLSLDLSSAGFIADVGVERLLERVARLRPDVVFANEAERDAVAQPGTGDLLGDLAPLVVLKQGRRGARAIVRGSDAAALAARAADIADSTGAGDAFDAGFLAAWLRVDRGTRLTAAVLERALRAGNRAARRECTGRRVEFELGELRPGRRRGQ